VPGTTESTCDRTAVWPDPGTALSALTQMSEDEDTASDEPHLEDFVTTINPSVLDSITNGDTYPLANIFEP
jgi:hypothetical protein